MLLFRLGIDPAIFDCFWLKKFFFVNKKANTLLLFTRPLCLERGLEWESDIAGFLTKLPKERMRKRKSEPRRMQLSQWSLKSRLLKFAKRYLI